MTFVVYAHNPANILVFNSHKAYKHVSVNPVGDQLYADQEKNHLYVWKHKHESQDYLACLA